MGAPASGGVPAVRSGFRLSLLAFASLVIGHEAVYHVHHGGGAEFNERMAALGHDGYWPIFSLLALSGAVVLALLGISRLARLWLRSRSLRLPAKAATSNCSYRRELVRLWAVLFPITGLGFAVQENIEHLAAGDGLIGVEALGLAGDAYPFALPVLGLVTLLVAAAGAALRWHVASLEERITRALWQQLLRPAERALRPVSWLIVSALCAHRWMRTRLQCVRAPPVGLPI